MSLARQFGLEAPPKDLPLRSDGTPFTSLAVCLKSRAQSRKPTTSELSMRVSRNNIPRVESDLLYDSDGGLSFSVFVDTETALRVCKTSLVSKGFHFAKLSEKKLLVVPRDTNISAPIGFELIVESSPDSACESQIRFSAPQSYMALSVRDAMEWSVRLKDLHHSISFGCR